MKTVFFIKKQLIITYFHHIMFSPLFTPNHKTCFANFPLCIFNANYWKQQAVDVNA